MCFLSLLLVVRPFVLIELTLLYSLNTLQSFFTWRWCAFSSYNFWTLVMILKIVLIWINWWNYMMNSVILIILNLFILVILCILNCHLVERPWILLFVIEVFGIVLFLYDLRIIFFLPRKHRLFLLFVLISYIANIGFGWVLAVDIIDLAPIFSRSYFHILVIKLIRILSSVWKIWLERGLLIKACKNGALLYIVTIISYANKCVVVVSSFEKVQLLIFYAFFKVVINAFMFLMNRFVFTKRPKTWDLRWIVW